MIKCNINGRLGNQLFQYAMCRSIQEKTGEMIEINIGNLLKNGFNNDLDFFVLNNNIKFTKKSRLNFRKFILYNFYKVKRKILFLTKYKTLSKQNEYLLSVSNKYEKSGIYLIGEGYYNFNLEKRDVLLDGCFESSKFFNHIGHIIKKEIVPKKEVLEHNNKLLEIIKNSNSVCVSIRRGDFLHNKYKKDFFICDENYFTKAINKIKEKISNPIFVFFSDDIEWVKKHFNVPENSYFESGNDPVWEKLRLMSNCKHFIISNSTFSWWAQFLSDNNHKIIISPNRWKNNDNSSDLIEDGWIKI